MNYRPNQIWKNRSKNDASAFLIQTVWKTERGTTRVEGVVIPAISDLENQDYDSRSVEKMWPVLAFNPPLSQDELDDLEDK